VKTLFETVAPGFKDRAGGYTRVLHLGPQRSDDAEMAIFEWVNYIPQPPKKRKKKTPAEQKETPGAAKDSSARKGKRKAKEGETKAAPKKKTAEKPG
jgi:large subunit ribosomal protein L17